MSCGGISGSLETDCICGFPAYSLSSDSCYPQVDHWVSQSPMARLNLSFPTSLDVSQQSSLYPLVLEIANKFLPVCRTWRTLTVKPRARKFSSQRMESFACKFNYLKSSEHQEQSHPDLITFSGINTVPILNHPSFYHYLFLCWNFKITLFIFVCVHGHAAEGHMGPGDCPKSRQQCLDSLSHLTDFSATFF